MPTESEFIRRLAQQFVPRCPVLVGIGDDGAVMSISGDPEMVVVTDMLLDGIHFELDQMPIELIGRKSIAVNLSDLAAMACRPTAAFVSIAVPRTVLSDDFLTRLYAGMESLADEFDFTIAGGDTNSWNGPFVINVCMTGIPFQDHAILRSGAQPGDKLVVTGPLGGSLMSGRHLTFEPRLRLARKLSESVAIHAMMDISDGLAMDLHRMMEASGTGAILEAGCIPVHSDVRTDQTQDDRLQAALSDGEDFELLIAIAPHSLELLQKACNEHGRSSIHVIGQVTEGRDCRIRRESGSEHDLPASGWEHLG